MYNLPVLSYKISLYFRKKVYTDIVSYRVHILQYTTVYYSIVYTVNVRKDIHIHRYILAYTCVPRSFLSITILIVFFLTVHSLLLNLKVSCLPDALTQLIKLNFFFKVFFSF